MFISELHTFCRTMCESYEQLTLIKPKTSPCYEKFQKKDNFLLWFYSLQISICHKFTKATKGYNPEHKPPNEWVKYPSEPLNFKIIFCGRACPETLEKNSWIIYHQLD